MRISLYLVDKIVDFMLPNQVSGSFTFDSAGSNLINVEARDNKWVLYSTQDVQVIHNGVFVDSVLLNDGFYTLKRDGKSYLIFAKTIRIPDMLYYSYDENFKCIIGNTRSCNFIYDSIYLNDLMVGIGYNNGRLVLEKKGDTVIYINKKAVLVNPLYINYGDQLDMYGLRIIFLKNVIIVSNLDNLSIDINGCNIRSFVFPISVDLIDNEIKDVDLYNKSDYASKAPRLRRIIETKKIGFSAPPSTHEEPEMPLILVIGPMFTMGIVSISMIFNVVVKVLNGGALKDNIVQIITGVAMAASTLVWPLVTRKYNDKMKKKKRKELIEKYGLYLKDKEIELDKELNLQKTILIENLINVNDCLNNIKSRNINFWSKRIDQNDFLVTRIGIGNELLNVEINLPEDEFTIEDNDLKKQADDLKLKYKYIENVPIGYSFYDNFITAIMGTPKKTFGFINNMLLQLLSFYSYEDLKIVVFTSGNHSNWDYIKYLNHNFNDDKSFRFFGSTQESIKNVADYLNVEVNNRVNGMDKKPYYLIIVDDYDKIKRYEFVETLTESDSNLGFSFIIVEDKLSRLPSKCDNFITLNENQSGVLKNSYEKQEQIVFYDEINYDIDMMDVSKLLSNIPVELENDIKALPSSISFMEMENVGKVEQLNILNRWNNNDSTSSLRCEVGVDENGSLMYLDLHEKYHGPHGLIAGMTGSGKSEFIITYILSMCINYSPDDVAFILIDYKGGGLAGAFSNRNTGVHLPHLVGTITNLDKAEMDRTLVSIDSEVKRRQAAFNSARDLLGESTIDIYKYQKFYKEGRLKDPIPHLFIICDEFAELKSGQPEFMDNLISVARIGRSLGVHLILATQKPSGVVNEQIWSNTKFRVCLKVQDESDSKEMLKRPEAASLKQTGRFYLQVGYDELFVLGQSAWCGAKYYPSDKIVKQVDKSVNFIDDCGGFIKSIQASGGIKVKPSGEQLSAILNNIIEVSSSVGKRGKRLWLPNIPSVIILDEIEEKYKLQVVPYEFHSVIGEYDAPERQEQGVVVYNFNNTIIYGNDGGEREMLLDSIIYGCVKNHAPSEVNFYIVDYGSESLRKYSRLPHVGGIVFESDDERYNNLFKMIKKEINYRKKLFADYGGEYRNYLKFNKLPLKVVILNNYDSIYEANEGLYDVLPDLVRDSERYGFVFIISAGSINSVHSKVSQSFSNIYALKLKDEADYSSLFGTRGVVPRNIFGRGLVSSNGVHEFQVTTISENLNDFISTFVDQVCSLYTDRAVSIPVLPSFVRFNDIGSINDLYNVPIGLDKDNLNVVRYDFLSNIGTIITSNRINNIEYFIKSLIFVFSRISNSELVVLDGIGNLNLGISNYYNSEFDSVVNRLVDYFNSLIESHSSVRGVVVLYGIGKIISKTDISKLVDLSKKYENFGIVIVDDYTKIKKSVFDAWFTNIFNVNNGIWIGRGISDQNLLHLSNVTRDMTKNYNNDLGYCLVDGMGELVKFIDFISTGDDDEG